jgi:hypothetical protein
LKEFEKTTIAEDEVNYCKQALFTKGEKEYMKAYETLEA